jgi:hypothetical protein
LFCEVAFCFGRARSAAQALARFMEFTIGDCDTVKPQEREIGIETGSVSTLIRMLAIGMMVLGAVFAVLDR